MSAYQDLSPTSKAAVDTKLKNLHEIIAKKKGSLHNEDEEMLVVKNAFKEIPVFRDIPNQFKVEALKFKTHDIVFDQRENQFVFILLQGEALIVQSEKQLSILQKTNFNAINTEIAQQSTGDTFEDHLELNQIRVRKQTIVAQRPLLINQGKKLSEELQKNLVPPNNDSNQANSGDPQTPSWKKNEDVKQIQIGDCFGQYYSLTGSKWRPSFVLVIKDETMILRAPVTKIDQILNKINSSEQHKQLLSFLADTIFGFDKISAAAKDKIARCFNEKQFYPGQKLIREGDIHNTAYIIKEGDCVLMSNQNPSDIRFNEEGKPVPKILKGLATLKQDQKKKGYMSKTTNTFQFGVKGKGQWVGEDILILNGQDHPFYFSVVAVGRVNVLEISRLDMVTKLPQQFVKYLEKSSLKRKDFVLQRMRNINQTIKVVIKQGEEKAILNEEDVKNHIKVQNQTVNQKLRSLTQDNYKQSVMIKKTIDLDFNNISMQQQNESSFRLPVISNPRDVTLLKSISRKGPNHTISAEDDIVNIQSQSQIAYKTSDNRGPSPILSRKAGNMNQNDIKKHYMSQINHAIEKKNIDRYNQDYLIQIRKDSQSETLTKKSLNLSSISQVRQSQQFNMNSRSIVNQSQAELSDIMERNDSVFGIRSNNDSFQDKRQRKIALMNAQTLKPYLHLKKQRDLVPIFYQKDPQKTRNFIANSIQMMKLNGEVDIDQINLLQQQLQQQQQPEIMNSNELRSMVNFHDEIQSVQKFSMINGEESLEYKTISIVPKETQKLSEEYHSVNQKQSLVPSTYQFSINNQSQQSIESISPIIKVKGKSFKDIDTRLQKEAKEKYGSFMVGNTLINELDKSKISLSKFRASNEYNSNHINSIKINYQSPGNQSYLPYQQSTQSNYSQYGINITRQDSQGRQETPNPYEEYKKREIRKSQMLKMREQQCDGRDDAGVRSALSYFNYDI
ncbi:UNKNOWN [Stylonychia lemnae]|uniref:Cyclic nucleotide-binding domain-containing protein n=1 Tax=Stylonychia lemnae TaxID=5949 RepID=A0A078ASN8_STYLE|nr:UNKNOWN [Stylonychia lemnae]|eukprot:CDW85500.1 UNKNOWN [Stylonychia lemnae]